MFDLRCAEAISLMRAFPDKYFNLACVDPDYQLGDKISNGGTWAAKYGKGDGDLGGKPTKEYFDELFRVSENQIIWGGNYFLDFLPSTRCMLVWNKAQKMDTLADFEIAWTSFDENSKMYYSGRNEAEQRIHITQKPCGLYDFIFKNYAKQGDKILDTMLGSASIALSVYKANIKHNMDYHLTGCEISAERFEKATLRLNTFISEYSPATEQPITASGQWKLI